MRIFIGNSTYSITEILINVNYYKKVSRFRIYHAFPNSLVILNKCFFLSTEQSQKIYQIYTRIEII